MARLLAEERGHPWKGVKVKDELTAFVILREGTSCLLITNSHLTDYSVDCIFLRSVHYG